MHRRTDPCLYREVEILACRDGHDQQARRQKLQVVGQQRHQPHRRVDAVQDRQRRRTAGKAGQRSPNRVGSRQQGQAEIDRRHRRRREKGRDRLRRSPDRQEDRQQRCGEGCRKEKGSRRRQDRRDQEEAFDGQGEGENQRSQEGGGRNQAPHREKDRKEVDAGPLDRDQPTLPDRRQRKHRLRFLGRQTRQVPLRSHPQGRGRRCQGSQDPHPEQGTGSKFRQIASCHDRFKRKTRR